MRSLRLPFAPRSLWSVCYFGVLGCGTTLVGSCNKMNAANKGGVKEYEKLKIENAQPIDFNLKRAPGLEYKKERFTIAGSEKVPKSKDRGAYLEEVDNIHLRFTFGKIPENTWQLLKTNYLSPANLKYSASHSYTLDDFLPHAAQALVGHRFLLQSQTATADMSLPDAASQNVTTATNCWGTAYEIARNDPLGVTVFFVDEWQMGPVMENNDYSEKIKVFDSKTVHPKTGDAKLRNKGLMPGDILLIKGPEPDAKLKANSPVLMHAAMFVDDDLWFEKTGTKSLFAYHLVTYADIANRSSNSIKGDFSKMVYEIRRFSTGQRTLPPPELMFQSAAGKATLGAQRDGKGSRASYYYGVTNLKYDFDKETGRANLPADAYKQSTFEID